MKHYLSYDDVALVPQYNNVDSRTEPVITSYLTRNTPIDIPIVASPMDTVIGSQMAEKLLQLGSIPIFHRFTSLEQQQKWIDEFGSNCFISAGLNHFEQTLGLLQYTGPKGPCKGVLLDVAHGHSHKLLEFVSQLKKNIPEREVIAGNIATAIAVQDLYTAGCDAVRVGIGAGSACITRIQTGFGLPMFSCVLDCANTARKLHLPVIADGGIEHPKDVAIALSAGASTVMIGKKMAQTFESSAPKTTIDGQMYVKYRGQASLDFQNEFYGGLKPGTVPEGVTFDIKCSGSVQDLLDNYTGALRSAFTYGGAKNIKEFQRKAEYVTVSSNYLREAHARPN